MFASMRRAMAIPLEFTNTHMRREFVAFIIENIDFFFPLLLDSIKGNYGMLRMTDEEYKEKETAGTLTDMDIQERLTPGPFTFVTYLKEMLKPSMWGDEIVLTVFSMMWQLTITVVTAETLLQSKIRHSRKLKDADMVLLHCGQNHYCGTGE